MSVLTRVAAMAILGIAFVSGAGPAGSAAPVSKTIASGDWSAPVTDRAGYALRGRWVIAERANGGPLREVAVYLEVQDASEAIGRTNRIYFDLTRSNAQPGQPSGLECEMRDEQGNLVPPTPFPFGGAVPASQWLTLPSDGALRVRTSPFGIRREKALAIAPDLGHLWVIPESDTHTYALKGTFTVAPREDSTSGHEGHVWRGTLTLPAVQISNPPPRSAKASAPN